MSESLEDANHRLRDFSRMCARICMEGTYGGEQRNDIHQRPTRAESQRFPERVSAKQCVTFDANPYRESGRDTSKSIRSEEVCDVWCHLLSGEWQGHFEEHQK